MEEFDLAAASFRTAISIFENEASYSQLGRVLVLKEEPEEAIEAYSEALRLSPNNSELMTAIGVLQLKNGNSDEAFDQFDRVSSSDPRFSDAMLGVANIHQNLEDFDQALVAYKAISTVNASSPVVWNNLGLLFFAQQKYVTVKE